jgi:hypothetical protein
VLRVSHPLAVGDYGNFSPHAVYVNECLINGSLFIYFLVRLAFRPSGGAPNAPQLATSVWYKIQKSLPSSHNSLSVGRGWRHYQLGMNVLELQQAWYKTYGRPSADDPCTPRAKRPPRQPRTLSVTVVGCSMGIRARTLRVDRGIYGFRGPSGAHNPRSPACNAP